MVASVLAFTWATAAAVHTTGVNWQAVSVIAGEIFIITGGVGAFIARSVKREVVDVVEKIIDDKVTPVIAVVQRRLDEHERDISYLKGIEEGKRQAVAQANLRHD